MIVRVQNFKLHQKPAKEGYYVELTIERMLTEASEL